MRVETNMRFACFSFLFVFSAAAQEGRVPRDGLFDDTIEEMFPRLVETRRHLHSQPELSNQEEKTAAYVAERLRTLGLEIKTGVAGHGIVALLKGKADGPCVAVRADMDALPVKELRARPWRSQNPGVMHACGHDVHTTVALGVAELLTRHRSEVKGTVKFLFQPAEEGMPPDFEGTWGAQQMVAEGAMENPHPMAVFGLHCRPTIKQADMKDDEVRYLKAGQVAYTIGADNANSDSFQITLRGRMAHGSSPHSGVDAITTAASAIQALQNIRSRMTNTQKPLVLSIGTIQGGQRSNIVADEVVMTGTVRTYDAALRDEVVKMMHRILKGVSEAHGATYELNYRNGYPSINNNADLIHATLPTFRRLLGAENVFEVIPGMGGEDFSYFAQVSPGFYFRLGVSNVEKGITHELHTPMFDVDETCLKTGVSVMAAAVCDFLDKVP